MDIPNVVTAVLASYRGYDTLGELVVVFTAGIGVLLLLGGPRPSTAPPASAQRRHLRMRETLVLRVVVKRFVPFVLLFALYVQAHGELGPGGGFQAGVIFAAGLALYSMIFGIEDLRRVVPARAVEWAFAGGVLLYLGVGVAGMLLGGNFLDYDLLRADDVAGQHLGIQLIELGVGLTVAAVMTTIYFGFAGRSR